jgi:hypothetical protein
MGRSGARLLPASAPRSKLNSRPRVDCGRIDGASTVHSALVAKLAKIAVQRCIWRGQSSHPVTTQPLAQAGTSFAYPLRSLEFVCMVAIHLRKLILG